MLTFYIFLQNMLYFLFCCSSHRAHILTQSPTIIFFPNAYILYFLTEHVVFSFLLLLASCSHSHSIALYIYIFLPNSLHLYIFHKSARSHIARLRDILIFCNIFIYIHVYTCEKKFMYTYIYKCWVSHRSPSRCSGLVPAEYVLSPIVCLVNRIVSCVPVESVL